jgi:hypothetical protein
MFQNKVAVRSKQSSFDPVHRLRPLTHFSSEARSRRSQLRLARKHELESGRSSPVSQASAPPSRPFRLDPRRQCSTRLNRQCNRFRVRPRFTSRRRDHVHPASPDPPLSCLLQRASKDTDPHRRRVVAAAHLPTLPRRGGGGWPTRRPLSGPRGRRMVRTGVIPTTAAEEASRSLRGTGTRLNSLASEDSCSRASRADDGQRA